MLRGKAGPELISDIHYALVEDMEDGGMGNIRLVSPRAGRRWRFGDAIAEAEYTNDDGVLVSITVNSYDRGELYVDPRLPCRRRDRPHRRGHRVRQCPEHVHRCARRRRG